MTFASDLFRYLRLWLTHAKISLEFHKQSALTPVINVSEQHFSISVLANSGWNCWYWPHVAADKHEQPSRVAIHTAPALHNELIS